MSTYEYIFMIFMETKIHDSMKRRQYTNTTLQNMIIMINISSVFFFSFNPSLIFFNFGVYEEVDDIREVEDGDAKHEP